jgi:hypothetical protein
MVISNPTLLKTFLKILYQVNNELRKVGNGVHYFSTDLTSYPAIPVQGELLDGCSLSTFVLMENPFTFSMSDKAYNALSDDLELSLFEITDLEGKKKNFTLKQFSYSVDGKFLNRVLKLRTKTIKFELTSEAMIFSIDPSKLTQKELDLIQLTSSDTILLEVPLIDFVKRNFVQGRIAFSSIETAVERIQSDPLTEIITVNELKKVNGASKFFSKQDILNNGDNLFITVTKQFNENLSLLSIVSSNDTELVVVMRFFFIY